MHKKVFFEWQFNTSIIWCYFNLIEPDKVDKPHSQRNLAIILAK